MHILWITKQSWYENLICWEKEVEDMTMAWHRWGAWELGWKMRYFWRGLHFLKGLEGKMWWFRLGFCLVCRDERSLVSKNEAFEILSVVKLILNWSTQKERSGISENNTFSWLSWNTGELFPIFLVWPITIYASTEVIDCIQNSKRSQACLAVKCLRQE